MVDVLAHPILRKHAAAIRAACRSGIELVAAPSAEESVGNARSRLGGYPDLPDDDPWPCFSRETPDGRISVPLAFLGQIALKDIAVYDVEGLLPHEGLLAFWLLDDVRMMRELPVPEQDFEARDRLRISYYPPGTLLGRPTAPQSLPVGHVLPMQSLTFRQVVTWPQPEGNIIGAFGALRPGGIALDEEAWNCWSEHAPKNPSNQLLGHPAGCEFPIGGEVDACLLLSLEAISSGLPWDVFGRNGFLFVSISRDALARRAWSEATHKQW